VRIGIYILYIYKKIYQAHKSNDLDKSNALNRVVSIQTRFAPQASAIWNSNTSIFGIWYYYDILHTSYLVKNCFHSTTRRYTHFVGPLKKIENRYTTFVFFFGFFYWTQNYRIQIEVLQNIIGPVVDSLPRTYDFRWEVVPTNIIWYNGFRTVHGVRFVNMKFGW